MVNSVNPPYFQKIICSIRFRKIKRILAKNSIKKHVIVTISLVFILFVIGKGVVLCQPKKIEKYWGYFFFVLYCASF